MSQLLRMSVTGGVLVVVIALLRAVLAERLPKRTFLALWAVALVRLVLPFRIPSPVSVYNAAPKLDLGPAPALTAPVLPAEYAAGAGANIPLLPLAWLIGALACGLFFLIAWVRCRREFREALPVEDEFSLGWVREQGLRRKVRLRQSDRVAAPLTYGLARPVVLMPKGTDWADRDRVRYVLTHEFFHIRRLDGLWKLLLTLALCLHWFNPLVWLMYALANRDLELSCDERVVRSFGAEAKKGYALTLLSMEEGRSGLRPLCNHFSKNAIEERIRAIMSMKKTTAWAMAAGLVVVIGVTVAFATSAADKETGPKVTPTPAITLGDRDLPSVGTVQDTVLSGEDEGWEEEWKVDPETGHHYTKAQYDLMAGLKTNGYEKQSIAQFNRELWSKLNADEKSSQDMNDAMWRLYSELPTDDPLAQFVYYTCRASEEEYSVRLDEVMTGKRHDPEFKAKAKRTEYADVYGDTVQVGQAEVDYTFTYRILDQEKLTVADRDKFLTDITAGMQAFLDGQQAAEFKDEDALKKAAQAELDRLGNAGTTTAISYSAGTIEWVMADFYDVEDWA